jgi:predicted pyridoxine 5'-phosphate oxidase superfamily flavin-nucleotide-binding protein
MATDLPGWPHEAPPFHAGEQAVQARVGVRERLAQVGPRVIRGEMPQQHRELFDKLPFLLLGALDAQRRPWATVAFGQPGFAHTPDARTMRVSAPSVAADTVPLQLHEGAPLGVLGLEPATRRRNRANGFVAASSAQGFELKVTQSFGNCPKYIQARDLQWHRPSREAPQRVGTRLPRPAVALVRGADTFFIATASARAGLSSAEPADGVDVSHRGGTPGFVHVEEGAGATVLRAPDFIGNFFFNTLGNLQVNPQAGLLFVDWLRGDLLLLSVRAEVQWDGPELEAFAGAQRLLRFELAEGWWLPGAMPWRAAPSATVG